MKTIENKKIKIPGNIEGYSDFIILCVQKPPQGGFEVSEMRKRIKVMDVIDKGGDPLEFEDAYFDCVKQCVKNMKWPFIHKEIIAFVDYISEL